MNRHMAKFDGQKFQTINYHLSLAFQILHIVTWKYERDGVKKYLFKYI